MSSRLGLVSFPREIKFDSFGDLLNKGIEYFSSQEGEYRYFFRGEPEFYDYPSPGIFRGFLKYEKEIFQYVLNQCPMLFRHAKTTFDMLCEMQHYGFPTRLLDVSTDLSMCWFMAVDGMNLMPLLNKPNKLFHYPNILVFRVPESREKFVDSDLVSLLSNTVRMNTKFNLGKLVYEAGQERMGIDCDYFDSDDMSKNWLVYPRLENPRVRRQKGAFILHGLLPKTARNLGVSKPKGNVEVDKTDVDPLTGNAFPEIEWDSNNRNRGEIVRCARLVPSQNYMKVLDDAICAGTTSDVKRIDDALKAFKNQVFKELSFVGSGETDAYADDFKRQSDVCRSLFSR